MHRNVAPSAMVLDATPRRALRLTVVVCAAAAVIALLAGIFLGQVAAGIAFAAGLLLGAGNGLLAQRLLAFGVPFVATSLMRLLALTGVAVASGVFLGWRRIVLVVVGMAVAQLVLSAASAREVLRRR
jgi:hypothetical protein